MEDLAKEVIKQCGSEVSVFRLQKTVRYVSRFSPSFTHECSLELDDKFPLQRFVLRIKKQKPIYLNSKSEAADIFSLALNQTVIVQMDPGSYTDIRLNVSHKQKCNHDSICDGNRNTIGCLYVREKQCGGVSSAEDGVLDSEKVEFWIDKYLLRCATIQ